jgi:hypothetical protein
VQRKLTSRTRAAITLPLWGYPPTTISEHSSLGAASLYRRYRWSAPGQAQEVVVDTCFIATTATGASPGLRRSEVADLAGVSVEYYA